MSTKLKRFTIVCPADLQRMIEREAELNQRPISNQLVWNLYNYYREKKQAADVFMPQLLAEERRQVPYFEPADQPEAEQPLKHRESKGGDRTR